jgi:hypothetical protein
MTYTKEHQEKGAELMRTLVEKAWESATFKDQLVNNPIATIQEFTNKSFAMPENKRLVVEDQTNKSVIYLNIPAQLNLDEIELTDEQLEMVAGGEVLGSVGIGLAIASMFAAGYCYGKSQQ